MPSQGPNSGSSGANDSTVGTVNWFSIADMGASDDNPTNTQLLNLQTSVYARQTNFGFSIPASATITGIEVEIERKDLQERAHDSTIRLYKGSFVGSNKADTGTPWPTTDTYRTYGGSSDTWSAGLTPSEINASTFGVGVSAHSPVGTAEPEIDHIRITVHYSTPPEHIVRVGRGRRAGN